MTPAVSVIVAAYREERRIAAALGSIAAQTLTALELIVVDDGSPDRTGVIAAAHGARVLRTAHRGTGAARAAGARAARGAILAFLDADDVFPPDFLAALVRPLMDGSARSTFPGGVTWHNPDEGLAGGWLRVRSPRDQRPPARAATHPWPMALFRGDLERIGGYPVTGYGEDDELGRLLDTPATVVPEATYAKAVPDTLGEVARSARWIGRGPRMARERPPLRPHLPPWSAARAARMLAAGDRTGALVRIVYDAALLTGVAERGLRPRVRDRA